MMTSYTKHVKIIERNCFLSMIKNFKANIIGWKVMCVFIPTKLVHKKKPKEQFINELHKKAENTIGSINGDGFFSQIGWMCYFVLILPQNKNWKDRFSLDIHFDNIYGIQWEYLSQDIQTEDNDLIEILSDLEIKAHEKRS